MSTGEDAAARVRSHWGATSDVGKRRALNEDSFLAEAPVFVVADGMGGHDAGEVASALVIEELWSFVGSPVVTSEQVQDCLAQAQDRIRAIEATPGRGAGTTVTGVVVTELEGVPYWLVLNLGDSRTYRLSEGELEQISVDHSEVQELIDDGLLTAAEAVHHPRRNVVTRALGVGDGLDVDYWLIPIEEHDRMLVCSDGLTGEVMAPDIAAILLSTSDPQSAADALVAAALAAGGKDNVTVLVIDAYGIEDSGPQEHTAPRSFPENDTEPDTEDTLPRLRIAEMERD